MGRDGATRRAFCFARLVMAGLVPAIHVSLAPIETKTWMPGTRPGMTKVIHFAAFFQSGNQNPNRLTEGGRGPRRVSARRSPPLQAELP